MLSLSPIRLSLHRGYKIITKTSKYLVSGQLSKSFCSNEVKAQDPNSLSTTLFDILEKDPTNERYKRALRVMSSAKKEWRHELKEGNYLPRQETIDYLEKHKYSWIEEPTNAKVILHKTTGEFLVELKFQVMKRKEVPLKEHKFPFEQLDLSRVPPHKVAMIKEKYKEDEFREELESHGKELQGPESEKQLVQIEVINNKTGDKLYLLVYVADELLNLYKVRMNHIRLFSSEDLACGLKGLKLFSKPGLYEGVNFHTLSEGLQRNLMKFLQTLGIEAEVFYHIEYLAVNREQRLYMEWLKNIHEFAQEDLLLMKEESEK